MKVEVKVALIGAAALVLAALIGQWPNDPSPNGPQTSPISTPEQVPPASTPVPELPSRTYITHQRTYITYITPLNSPQRFQGRIRIDWNGECSVSNLETSLNNYPSGARPARFDSAEVLECRPGSSIKYILSSDQRYSAEVHMYENPDGSLNGTWDDSNNDSGNIKASPVR
jgi:hypothetical protein